jgi:hypothetical protein
MKAKGFRLILCLTAIFVIVLAHISCDPTKGIIMGKVKYQGQPCSGAYVLLLAEHQLITGNQPLGNGSITLGDGSYTIINVTPDTYYYVVAVKDIDGDLKYTPGVDALGYYGSYDGFSWIPTSVIVSAGQTLTGIDIGELYIIPVP